MRSNKGETKSLARAGRQRECGVEEKGREEIERREKEIEGGRVSYS